MYTVGRRMGGEPEQLGQLIDQNMTEVLKLRQKRTQETGTIIGVIYGITATSTFAFFVGLEVVKVLRDVTGDMEIGQTGLGGLLNAQVYNLPEIQFMLFVTVLINAFLSSMMIRVVDRGHSMNALPHFVIQTWLAAIIAVVTRYLVSGLISV
jgi:flagellar protein FlaJ